MLVACAVRSLTLVQVVDADWQAKVRGQRLDLHFIGFLPHGVDLLRTELVDRGVQRQERLKVVAILLQVR